MSAAALGLWLVWLASAGGWPPSVWTHFAGEPARGGGSRAGPALSSLGVPTWTANRDEAGRVITFMGQAGVIASRDLVMAPGSVVIGTTQHRLFAFDRRTGQARWSASIAAPFLNSWSTAVVDEQGRMVIHASGRFVTAFALDSGAVRWQTELPRAVVNASPLVTRDLGGRNRLFISDFDGTGREGRLHCINIDMPWPVLNPFERGEVVWSAPIGASSGNTPAYLEGRVYVASPGEGGAGRIYAFDARATGEPAPLWTFENVIPEGFFGGVCVRREAEGVRVYAASYAFFGGTESANLVKVDGETGALIWSAPSNRTAATPIVLEDCRVVLSAGLQGFGSVPAIQVFEQSAGGAALAWDSSIATWTDFNKNGRRDPGEFTVMGGWTHQPALSTRHGGLMLFAGAVPTGGNSYLPCTALFALDLGPQGPIEAARFDGAGSTPALADGNLYTIGAGGLFAFGALPPNADVNRDGEVGVEDLYAFEAGLGERDVNGDGVVNDEDRRLLVELIRAGEFEDMHGGRR